MRPSPGSSVVRRSRARLAIEVQVARTEPAGDGDRDPSTSRESSVVSSIWSTTSDAGASSDDSDATMDSLMSWITGRPADSDVDVERGGQSSEDSSAMEEREGREYAAQRAAELLSGPSRETTEERAARLIAERKQQSDAQKRRAKEIRQRINESDRQDRIRQREEFLTEMASRCCGGVAKCCSCSWRQFAIMAIIVFFGMVVSGLVCKYSGYYEPVIYYMIRLQCFVSSMLTAYCICGSLFQFSSYLFVEEQKGRGRSSCPMEPS